MKFYIIDDGVACKPVTLTAIFTSEESAEAYREFLNESHNIDTQMRALEGFAGVVIKMGATTIQGVN